MAKQAPANRRRVSIRPNTDLVNRLNALDPGLGSLYAADVRRTSTVMNLGFSAAAGQRGPVLIAGPRRDATGNQPAAVRVEGAVAGGKGTRGDEFMTRDQIRSMFTCEAFGGHPSGFPGWFEECVDARDREAATTTTEGDGRIHAMWGYTWDVPNFEDVTTGDPGVSEFGYGTYWQMQVPETTVLDTVSFRIPFDPGLPVLAEGPVGFALYSLDTAAASADIVVKSETVQALGLGEGRHTLALEERVTLDSGLYAVAYLGPCFDMSVINALYQEWTMVNELWELARYGNFLASGPFDAGGTANLMPDTLEPTEEFNLGVVPMTYWHDSAQFD